MEGNTPAPEPRSKVAGYVTLEEVFTRHHLQLPILKLSQTFEEIENLPKIALEFVL